MASKPLEVIHSQVASALPVTIPDMSQALVSGYSLGAGLTSVTIGNKVTEILREHSMGAVALLQ